MARGVTSVGVGLDAVAVLQPVGPGALVPGRRVQALTGAVATLEAARPLSPVQPLALGLHAESVAFPLRPVASVHVAAGPGVHADRLEAAAPRARIFALALGSGAHALAVSFAVLPASAVGAPIVEVEAAARHSETEFQMERTAPATYFGARFFQRPATTRRRRGELSAGETPTGHRRQRDVALRRAARRRRASLRSRETGPDGPATWMLPPRARQSPKGDGTPLPLRLFKIKQTLYTSSSFCYPIA